MKRGNPRKPTAYQFPCVVKIDTREQRPYQFADLIADVSQGGGPLIVETVTGTLVSGDYSLCGFEDRIAVERKSLADLFGTIGGGRDRFERELDRLNAMEFAAVVVEGQWSEVFDNPPRHSKLSPKTVFRSVNAWEHRYPRVHWHFLPGRDFAEVKAFRVLERYYKVATAGVGQ